jgi:hypothetical protein
MSAAVVFNSGSFNSGCAVLSDQEVIDAPCQTEALWAADNIQPTATSEWPPNGAPAPTAAARCFQLLA